MVNEYDTREPTVESESHRMDADRIRLALAKIRHSIQNDFKDRGLYRRLQLLESAALSTRRVAKNGIESHPFRVAGALALFLMLSSITYLIIRASMLSQDDQMGDLHNTLEIMDAVGSLTVLLGTGVYLWWRFNSRRRRRQALEQLHILRCHAQIIDMGQSDKTTLDSGDGSLTIAQRVHYLEASERAITLAGKLASILIVGHEDRIVIAEVTEIEQLCNSVAIRIWQKIGVLNQQRIALGEFSAA